MQADTIGLLGGTGRFGRGLALRLAANDHDVLVGSRSANRARAAASHIRQKVPGARIRGTTNAEAAARSDFVFITLPIDAVDPVLSEVRTDLTGKVVVDVANPIRLHDGRFEVAPLPEGSAAEHIQHRLPGVPLVSALKTVSADAFAAIEVPLQGDLFICGDDDGSKATVAKLLGGLGGRVIDLGALTMARDLEHVVAMLLNLNRRFKASTSIRIVGLRAR